MPALRKHKVFLDGDEIRVTLRLADLIKSENIHTGSQLRDLLLSGKIALKSNIGQATIREARDLVGETEISLRGRLQEAQASLSKAMNILSLLGRDLETIRRAMRLK